MTGISSRENPRSSKTAQSVFSSETAAFRSETKPSHATVPVLFRLPSISGSPGAVSSYGSYPQLAGSVAIPISPPQGESTQANLSNQASRPLAALTAESADASQMIARPGFMGRIFQLSIVVLLLLALALLSFIALRPHFAAPELAADESQLEPPSVVFLPESTDSSTTAAAVPAAQAISPSSSAPADSLLSGLEINETAKPLTSRAQVQLGLPVPVKASSKGLAAGEAAGAPSSLPLSTPRYETVSSPGSTNETPAIPSSGSPALWDGAQKTTQGSTQSAASGELTKVTEKTESSSSLANSGSIVPALPWPVPPENATGATEAETAESNSLTSQLKLPTPNRDSSTVVSAPALLDPMKLPTRLASPAPSAGSGVTVGGQATEPDTLAKATATPDLDAAAISKKYLDYVQRKSSSPSSASMPAPAITTSAPAISGSQPTASVTPYVRTAPAGSSSPAQVGKSDTMSFPSASPTMPTSNPVSSSAPVGLIGGTGYATAPSGDVTAPIPVMGRMGVNSAAPPTGVQTPAGNASGSPSKP